MEINSAGLDAAFTNFGEHNDFPPFVDTSFYEITSRNAWPSVIELANSAEEGLFAVRDFLLMRGEITISAGGTSSPLAHAYFGARGAIASDIQELATSTSAGVPMVGQEGRTPVVDLRVLAVAAMSRGWTDSAQGLVNFGWQGLSLGSSPGTTAGTLASSNVAYRGSPFLDTVATSDIDTSGEQEVEEDTTLAAGEPERPSSRVVQLGSSGGALCSRKE